MCSATAFPADAAIEHHGQPATVLVSQRLEGETLADRLIARPARTAELLEQVWDMVRPLHRPARPGLTPGRPVLVPRGSIPATFGRKLSGESGNRLIADLGTGWLDGRGRTEVRRSVARSVAELGRLHPSFQTSEWRGESGVVFGDLKPEHVIYHQDAGPLLCDPMLTSAGSVADAAKLVSRTVLAVHATATPSVASAGVADGVGSFIEARLRERLLEEQPSWLRALLVLWAMDALNIATTHLAAPVDLPVAGPLAAVSRWAPRMVHLASVLVDHLAKAEATRALEAAADALRVCT